MQEKLFRQEIKSLLSPTQALLLENRISAVLQPDMHAGPEGAYFIRSIYFDTGNDKAYREKLMGVSEREKYRIRMYDLDAATVQLERKEKKESLIHKEAVSISRECADQMVKGNFEGLLAYDHPLAADMYSKAKAEQLKPVVVVDYYRKAYTYPAGNVRITFDYRLQSKRIEDGVWNRNALYDVLGENTVLEIKFNQYIPEHIRQLLCSVTTQRMAVSKYTLCRENLYKKQGYLLGGKG